MAAPGKYNDLKIIRMLDFGAVLDGEEFGEIRLPKRCLDKDSKTGDTVKVFLYTDSDDKIAATTDAPMAQVGDFAFLECIEVNDFGAFLDWGIPKDLFVPFREQKMKMEEGKSYVVYIYFDEESKRIAASSKVEKFLDNVFPKYEEYQEVEVMVIGQTDLGFKVIVNNLHTGMLYKNEVFQRLRNGQQLKAYVKKVRDDDKIDLLLDKPGPKKVDALSQKILDRLQEQGGFMNVTDKSSAEYIARIFGVSKKTYKKAIGALYKARMIRIEDDGIYMI